MEMSIWQSWKDTRWTMGRLRAHCGQLWKNCLDTQIHIGWSPLTGFRLSPRRQMMPWSGPNFSKKSGIRRLCRQLLRKRHPLCHRPLPEPDWTARLAEPETEWDGTDAGTGLYRRVVIRLNSGSQCPILSAGPVHIGFTFAGFLGQDVVVNIPPPWSAELKASPTMALQKRPLSLTPRHPRQLPGKLLQFVWLPFHLGYTTMWPKSSAVSHNGRREKQQRNTYLLNNCERKNGACTATPLFTNCHHLFVGSVGSCSHQVPLVPGPRRGEESLSFHLMLLGIKVSRPANNFGKLIWSL